MRWALLLLLGAAMAVSAVSAQFQTGPCAGTPQCKCKWSEGKRMADCRNAGFNAVPTTLSDDIQGRFDANSSFTSRIIIIKPVRMTPVLLSEIGLL